MQNCEEFTPVGCYIYNPVVSFLMSVLLPSYQRPWEDLNWDRLVVNQDRQAGSVFRSRFSP